MSEEIFKVDEPSVSDSPAFLSPPDWLVNAVEMALQYEEIMYQKITKPIMDACFWGKGAFMLAFSAVFWPTAYVFGMIFLGVYRCFYR